MKFIRETSPYIRKKVSVRRMMVDVLIALLPVTVFAVVQNGFKGLSVILMSIVTMLFFELLAIMMIKWPKDMKKKELFTKEGFAKVKQLYTINNITAPLISAVIYALLLPSGTNLYVVFIGAFFGIVIAKMLFGGFGSNIFNPAAIGRIVVGTAFGSKLIYTNGGVDVAVGGTPLAQLGANVNSLAESLKDYSLIDLFLGNVPGSMGEVSALLIIIAGIYLVIRRSADFRSMFSTIISFTIIMIVAALATNQDVIKFTLYQVLAGGLLFGAVFMVTDPITSPTTKFGRIVFGTAVGIIASYIRLLGAYPEGVAFAIIIMNMFVPVIDYYKWSSSKYSYKQFIGLIACVAILALIIVFAV